MRKPAPHAAEPIIEIKKNGSTWEVHWDYQEAPESSVLFKRQEYLGRYIDGSMDMLGILPANVLCARSVTGSVKKLTEEQATKLRDALESLLIPVVKHEFTRLQKLNELPHLRFAASESV